MLPKTPKFRQLQLQELSIILNDPLIQKYVFGSKHLCDDLGGNKNYGEILYRILIAHMPKFDGYFELKDWDENLGNYTFYHSAKQLARETNVSEKTIQRAVNKFKQLGFLDWVVKQTNKGHPTRHFYLNLDKLAKAISNLLWEFGSSLNDRLSWFWSGCPEPIYILPILEKGRREDPERSQIKLRDPINPGQSERKKTTSPKLREKPDPEVKQNEIFLAVKQTELATETTNQGEETITRDVEEIVNRKPKLKAIATLAFRAIANNFYEEIKGCYEHFNKKNERLKTAKERKNTLVLKGRKKKTVYSKVDPFLNRTNPLEAQKDRAKETSLLKYSRFKSVEQMLDCEEKLVEFFQNDQPAKQARKEAEITIAKELKGMHRVYVTDFLNGNPIGFSDKEEYELTSGVLLPVFEAYCLETYHKKDGTPGSDQRELRFAKKHPAELRSLWKTCKQLIDTYRPKIEKGILNAQNAAALDIPRCFIEAFRPEKTIEEIKDTAQAMSKAAIAYHDQNAVIQEQLNPKKVDSLSSAIDGNITAIGSPKNEVKEFKPKQLTIDQPVEINYQNLLPTMENKTEKYANINFVDQPEPTGQQAPHKTPKVKGEYAPGTYDTFVPDNTPMTRVISKDEFAKARERLSFLKSKNKPTGEDTKNEQ